MLKQRIVTAATVALVTTFAHASMPMLTPLPESITVRTCSEWARAQDEEAIDMWGVQQEGSGSYELGIHRLTSECLGEPVSDIVGFGSSVGFDDKYCSRHRDVPICTGNSNP